MSTIVSLHEKLPCGVLTDAGNVCGKPANLAHLVGADECAGTWTIRPVCSSCSWLQVGQYQDDPASMANDYLQGGEA